MFVRWQARKRRDGDVHWAAVLVESAVSKASRCSATRPISAASPRARSEMSLGNVTSGAASTTPALIVTLIDSPTRITPQDRQRIETALQAKVPRPTKQEFDSLNEWRVVNGATPI